MDCRVFKQLVSHQDKKIRVAYAPVQLPLAVYRELAAHLNQVEAIDTELVWSNRQKFDYADSQIDSIWIKFAAPLSDRSYALVESILNHYGSWQIVNSQSEQQSATKAAAKPEQLDQQNHQNNQPENSVASVGTSGSIGAIGGQKSQER
jgi:hypothetical protein